MERLRGRRLSSRLERPLGREMERSRDKISRLRRFASSLEMTKRCRLVFLANLTEGRLECIDGLAPAAFSSDEGAQVFS